MTQEESLRSFQVRRWQRCKKKKKSRTSKRSWTGFGNGNGTGTLELGGAASAVWEASMPTLTMRGLQGDQSG